MNNPRGLLRAPAGVSIFRCCGKRDQNKSFNLLIAYIHHGFKQPSQNEFANDVPLGSRKTYEEVPFPTDYYDYKYYLTKIGYLKTIQPHGLSLKDVLTELNGYIPKEKDLPEISKTRPWILTDSKTKKNHLNYFLFPLEETMSPKMTDTYGVCCCIKKKTTVINYGHQKSSHEFVLNIFPLININLCQRLILVT